MEFRLDIYHAYVKLKLAISNQHWYLRQRLEFMSMFVKQTYCIINIYISVYMQKNLFQI